MKATGIVRRVDDLGRVVITKEIRRSLRIREGDPLEIYTDGDSVVFKKYRPISDFYPCAEKYAAVLNRLSSHPVLITDMDYVVAVCGASKGMYLDKTVSTELSNVMDRRRIYTYQPNKVIYPLSIDGYPMVSVVCPIIAKGEVYGSVVLLAENDKRVPSEADVKHAQIIAAILGCQLED